jgi:hypothetical protein
LLKNEARNGNYFLGPSELCFLSYRTIHSCNLFYELFEQAFVSVPSVASLEFPIFGVTVVLPLM